MRLIRGVDITLDSSDVADTTYPAYDAGTTYALGDYVSATGSSGWTHEYRSLANANTGNALNDSAWWLDTGPANRYAMFDDRVGTKTTTTSSITVQCTPAEKIDSILLNGLDGAQNVHIEVVAEGSTLLDQTYYLNETGLGTAPTDWWEYFFGELDDYKTTLSVDFIVAYSTADITITINGATGLEVGVGLLKFGRAKTLAATLIGPTIGVTDYSRKETDEFGNPYILERGFANKGEFDLIIDTPNIDYFVRTLARVRAQPVMFDFNENGTNHDSFRLWGWYRDFTVNLTYATKSYCTIECEQMI